MINKILSEIGNELKKEDEDEMVVYFIDPDKDIVKEIYKGNSQVFTKEEYKKRVEKMAKRDGGIIVKFNIPRPDFDKR